MRRFLLVFLMLLMPLQSVWSAAASVCEHEQTVNAKRHFGHHDAHHVQTGHGEATADASAAEQPGHGSPGKTPDTDHHHVLSVNPVPHIPLPAHVPAGSSLDTPDPFDRYPSALVASLERPPRVAADLRRQGI